MTTAGRHQIAALGLMGAAPFAAALWGGMLYDRVLVDPQNVGIINLIGFPLTALLSAGGLAVALWFDTARWSVTWRSGLFGGFVLLACVSIYGSPNPYTSLVTFAILGSAVAVGWGLERLRLPAAALLGFAAVVVTAASIVSGFGISEYAAHIARPPRDFGWRVFSSFASPNFLAGFLAMTVPLTAACLLAAREKQVRLLMGLGLIVQTACILLTGSRFGLLSLVGGAVTLIWICARGGLFRGMSDRSARTLGFLFLAAALLGSVPVAKRLFQSGGESHSSQFRLYTWKGTARMAAAKPLLGTGLGSFDSAYGPYAETAFTQHAHNTYLQIAAECGIPAALVFVMCAFAAIAAGISGARQPSIVNVESEIVDSKPTASMKKRRRNPTAPAPPAPAVWAESAVQFLSAGAAAGLVSGLLRNLFDSDLYVPANALTFGALIGIAFSVRRLHQNDEGAAPETRRAPRRLLAVFVVVFAALYLGPYALGRMTAYSAESALLARDGENAIARYERAVRLNSLNPDYHLKLASLYAARGEPAKAEAEYKAAVLAARMGKPNYQYARFLLAQNRIDDAVVALETARTLEPNNLQNLLALADAYAMARRHRDAEAAYRRIVDLHNSPFGRIRAVPELIEYEFGDAHRALGMIALSSDDRRAAESHLRKAVEILGDYWGRRKNPMVQIQVRPEKVLMVGEIYHQALESLATMLENNGRAAEADEVRKRSAVLQEELSLELLSDGEPAAP